MKIIIFFEYGKDFFLFWKTAHFLKIFRFFWFFFVFEFVRYVVFDFVVVVFFKIKNYFKRSEYEKAREELFIKKPFISVISPGRNEGENILKLVKTLHEQTYRNFEIIIIDDGSDDSTPQICRTLLKEGKIAKYLRNDIRGGKASVANLGLSEAKGDFILHIDADTSLDRDAIEKIMIPFFIDSKIGVVGGNVKVRNATENLCTILQAIEYLKTITVGRTVLSQLNTLRIASGAFGVFRRDIIERFGGWDVGPGMDGDIAVKIRKLGYRVYFEPKAVCFTSPPKTFKALIKQRLRWSRSLVRFRMRKHRDIFFPTENFYFSNFISFTENIFYSVVLDLKWLVYITDMILHFPSTLKYILPANYFLYLMSNLFQFFIILWFSERKKEELKLIIYLPLVPIYVGIFMRLLRTYAYFQEFFFKTSYQDPWNPGKVSKKAKEIGI